MQATIQDSGWHLLCSVGVSLFVSGCSLRPKHLGSQLTKCGEKSMQFRRFVTATLLLLTASLFSIEAMGQSTLTGEIDGTVTDPSGAVVSGATVTLKNTEMGITETVTTNAGGGFRLPLLKPATYQLAVTQAGFRTVSQNVSVGVGQVVTSNLKLEVGRTSEIVEVTGAAPMLQTENANL